MKTEKIMKKFSAGILLALFIIAGIPAVPVQAAAGTVYTCAVHPSYRHPVTGEIEDSGGEASYATGQGMVDGAVYPTGILELTDSGEYYLTIRMSLMDYTANHSFWVQNVGDSGWSTPALGVTGSGTDNNGATSDICIQVPSENCVIRAAMYVEPMGRDVIFYIYPSDFVTGNNTDMNATIVTEASGSSTGSQSTGAAQDLGTSSQNTDNSASGNGTSSSGNGNTVTPSASSLPSGNTGAGSTSGADSGSTEGETGNSESTDNENTEDASGATGVQVLENTIEDPADSAQETETPSTEDTELDSAQGLSLSTAREAQAEDQVSEASGSTTAGSQILVLIISITVSGLLLIGAAAAVIYYFRRNWRRWGGGEDDDE
ncbi:MAG TPA: hypothetical protein H9913_11160 [Candidatus Blautia stercoripullorum]|uniref:Cell surface protein Shp haem-binding domain-containing protein n=1 Tax=Candidatus Blautia stercoripullorum TaxID=2838502 RepID=A0A9D2R8S7_9FIRM|nr:hypothetical protein [Candidatus Blautia stercoripullorum]